MWTLAADLIKKKKKKKKTWQTSQWEKNTVLVSAAQIIQYIVCYRSLITDRSRPCVDLVCFWQDKNTFLSSRQGIISWDWKCQILGRQNLNSKTVY